MTRKRLRTALLATLAAVSAWFEAPRFANESLSTVAAEISASPAAIGEAVTTAATAVAESHPGFDTNIYPGDRAMDAWKQSGEYQWVGYYLEGACHKDASWSGTRARLTDSGWGLAVIYVGQQTWGHRLTPGTPVSNKISTIKKSKRGRRSVHVMARRSTKPVAKPGDTCSASYVGADRGQVDARDAIAKASREGFAKGSVVFLDVEHMDVVPQVMRDYYRAWARTLLADATYRPGIYAHTANAATIFEDVSDVYTAAGVDGDPPFWIAGSSGFSSDRLPSDVGHAFASVWQGMLDVVRTHNGVKLPIDISVSASGSPSKAQ